MARLSMIRADWSMASFSGCEIYGERFEAPLSPCGEPGVLGEIVECINKDSKERETLVLQRCAYHYPFFLGTGTAFDLDSGRKIERNYW